MSTWPVDYYAIAAVAGCAFTSGECAAFLNERQRLATSLKFFALAWVVLLPYYALTHYLPILCKDVETMHVLKNVSEFLPTYSGILTLASSEPLWQEVATRAHKPGWALKIVNYVTRQSIPLIVFSHGIWLLPVDDQQQALRWTDIILAGLAFLSISAALWFLYHKRWKLWTLILWVVMAVICIGYFGYQIWWGNTISSESCGRMSDQLMIIFAKCKVALTLTFVALVCLAPVGLRRRGNEVA
jgi:hypothetical protein